MKTIVSFQNEHLEEMKICSSRPDLHMVFWKYPIHPDTIDVIGWTIGGMVHLEIKCQDGHHLSPTMTLGNLIFEFPWGLG